MGEDNKEINTNEEINTEEKTAPVVETSPEIEAPPVEIDPDLATSPAPVPTVEPVTEALPTSPEEVVEPVPVVEPIVNTAAAEQTQVVESAPAPVQESVPEVNPTQSPVQEQAPEVAVTPAPVEASPEEPKKKSKLPLILLIIILLAAIGFAVWFFVLGGNGSKSNNDNKEEQKQEEKQNEKEENKPAEPVKVTEAEAAVYKDFIGEIIQLKGSNAEFANTEIKNQDILYFAYNRDELKGKTEFTSSELANVIKANGFGDISYTNETINCFCGQPLIEYSAENDKYVRGLTEHAHGGKSFLENRQFFVDGEKDEGNGTLTLKYKVVYGQTQDDLYVPNPNLYPTAQDSINKTNGFFEEGESKYYGTDEDYKKAFDEFGDKIPMTTFYFEKGESGVYTFKKVETK